MPPWKRPRPKKRVKHLTSAQKSSAKARARKAGRSYPSLVDNMNAARGARKKKAPAKKRAAHERRKAS
jgi:hypothetical protein